MPGTCCASCALNRPCQGGDCQDHVGLALSPGDHVGLALSPGLASFGVVGQDAHIGDIGADILNVFRSVDDVLSTAIVEPLLDTLSTTDLGQYSNIVRDLHDTRREAQERAAPRTGPGGIPGLGASPPRAPVLPTAAPKAAPTAAPTAAPRSGAPSVMISPARAAAILSLPTVSQGLAAGRAALGGYSGITPRATLTATQNLVRLARKGDAASQKRLANMKQLASEGDPKGRRDWLAAVLVMRDDDAASARAARMAGGLA